ncbi:DNA-directed RNA polymerase subunit beta [Rickettsiales bacterium]|nr:DNA-directed RNA polymerase subunit beta [Rickettsiales bacterium]|tara:strand:- start:4434 stop:8519 length:4086 start_codon:yes stop_codon:yes gene_type:complete
MSYTRNFSQNIIRKSFNPSVIKDEAIPNLISLQKDSYYSFLQIDEKPSDRVNKGIQAVFNSVFPISDSAGKVTIEFLEYKLGAPKYEVSECSSAGRTFSSPLRAQLRLILWQNSDSEEKEIKSIKEQEVYLCEVPLMTESGSFIINGAERVIVSQMRRAPGVFFDSENSKISGSKTYTAKIVPYLGSWLDFEFDGKDLLYFRVDKKKKIPVSTLLRSLGLNSSQIISKYYKLQEANLVNKKWTVNFDQEIFMGKKMSYDLICAKTGNIVIKEGQKLNKKALTNLQDINFSDYELTDDVISGYVVVEDVIEKETGEILLESGTDLSDEALDILGKLNINSIKIVNPSKSDIGPYIYNTLMADKVADEKEALIEIYKSIRLGEAPSSVDIAKNYFDNLFFSSNRYNLSDVGRMKMNHRLSINIDKEKTFLDNEDIIQTIKILCETKHNDLRTDDIDSLTNRRVRSVGELVENQLRIGMVRVEKTILEKINSVEVDTVMPQSLINSKPLITAIKDFFATSQLSQFMDQTNPLSDITHKRKISALGPGGLTRERAGFEVRDVHPTHYGRICPIETPEGPNIGLINSLATFAKVNNYGFIETPYYKVENGKISNQIEYLSAMDEMNNAIAQSNVEVDENKVITSELVRCRRNGEFIMLPSSDINYIDVSTKQIVSAATTLIPFLENDDANRALMGANMQRQAVPLINPDSPLVGTGMESVAASDCGVVLKSKEAGIVKFVDAKKIIIESSDKMNPNIEVYNLKKYKRTNQDTCINQKPLVEIGQHVEKDQIICDGHSVHNGEIALGKNVRVAFMPWNGYNFEDSIIISEKVISDDTFTSLHIEELEVVARDTRLGPEEITRDIPNVSEELLSKLDEEGIVHIGAEVRPGDLLVGKTTPKSEAPMTPEEKLLKVIFGEKASDVKDSSLYASTDVSGTVVDVRVLSRKGIEKDERSIYIEMQKIEDLNKDKASKTLYLENAVKKCLNSIFTGKKITNNISDIKSGIRLEEDALNSLSVKQLTKIAIDDSDIMDNVESITKDFNEKISNINKEYEERVLRIKSGDDLGQGVLKIVKIYVASKYRLQPGDKMAGRHGNKGVVSKIAPVEDMPFSEDGQPVDIVLNPLGVPSRMNIGQILETHLGFASKELGKKIANIFDQASQAKDELVSNLKNKLFEIYDAKEEQKKIKNLTDNQLINFAQNLKRGIPFATGIFEGFKEGYISKLLNIAGVDSSGQINLFDGKSGEKFDRPITVGYIYMLKLHHLVDDKIHARSIGPYSLITQQPLGGKSHFGGQRFGEMECWALQAYGASYTLQEMLTVKSDDVVGRIKIYESIIQGNQNFNCGIPESFNVMIKEVRSLGLNIELVET